MKPLFAWIVLASGWLGLVTRTDAQNLNSAPHLREPAKISFRFDSNPPVYHLLNSYATNGYDQDGNEFYLRTDHPHLSNLPVLRNPAQEGKLSLPSDNTEFRYQLTPLYQDPGTKDVNRQYFPK